MAGADLGGTDIENHARCIERSYKMLTLLENSVNLLRTHHQSGEVYYWILYYSFLSPQKLKNVEEIIEVLRPHIRDISFSTYYRLRKAAVEALSSVLWGFSAQDTLKTLDCFFGFIENLVVFYLENSGHKITLYTKRWFALANHFFLCYNIFRYFSIFGGFLLTLNQYLL